MNTAAQLREIRRMLLNVQHEIDDKLSDLMEATMDTEICKLAKEVWDAMGDIRKKVHLLENAYEVKNDAE